MECSWVTDRQPPADQIYVVLVEWPDFGWKRIGTREWSQGQWIHSPGMERIIGWLEGLQT